MSKRSRSLADDLKAKEAAEKHGRQEQEFQQKIADQKILRDEAALADQAPKLWKNVSDEIRKQCHDFNSESAPVKLSVNIQVLNRVTVSYVDTNNVTRELRVSYD